MIQRCAGDHSGMTLIELVVVMAIVGLTAGIAGVYISSGETQLRTTLRNLQFDLEQAKQEAITRNTDVTVDISKDPRSFDCNNDGPVDEKDVCYVIYQDIDGVPGYDPVADRTGLIKMVPLDTSIQVDQSQIVTFSPMGSVKSDPNPATIQIRTVVENENCANEGGCLVTSYPLKINSVGGIHVDPKEEGCAGCSD